MKLYNELRITYWFVDEITGFDGGGWLEEVITEKEFP